VSALVEHCLELLSPLGEVRARRMFGGHGLYIDDLFVAVIAFDRLYLKADEASRPDFIAAGCEPFVYTKPSPTSRGGTEPPEGVRGGLGRTGAAGASGRNLQVTMSYWTVPAEAMESPALMQPWARQAIAAALRARSARPSAAPRKTRAAKASTGARARRRQP
jgi:DNA transformation protein